MKKINLKSKKKNKAQIVCFFCLKTAEYFLYSKWWQAEKKKVFGDVSRS